MNDLNDVGLNEPPGAPTPTRGSNEPGGSPAEPCSLFPCICGEEAELDWGGCTDWNGRSWQRVDAGCKECFRSVSIEIDSDRDEERALAHRLAGGMWNEFIKANSQDHAPEGSQ